MKTREELLRIYSAYLPYNVTVRTALGTDLIMKGISARGSIQDERGLDYTNIERGKLHLWDLFHLTKEIEHEGRKFIPIVELLKIKYPNQQGRYAETEFETEGYPFACFSVDAGKQIKVNTSYLQDEPFWIIQKLTEWKLNIFSLPEDQFINKATLKQ